MLFFEPIYLTHFLRSTTEFERPAHPDNRKGTLRVTLDDPNPPLSLAWIPSGSFWVLTFANWARGSRDLAMTCTELAFQRPFPSELIWSQMVALKGS